MLRALFACALVIGCGNKHDELEHRVDEQQAALDEMKRQAEAQAAAAAQAAKEAQAEVERLEKESGALMQEFDAAVTALAGAQTQAERDAATAKLGRLRMRKAEHEAKIAEAKARAARAQRGYVP